MNPFISTWDVIKYLEDASLDHEPLNKREVQHIKDFLTEKQNEIYKAEEFFSIFNNAVAKYKEYR